MLLVALITLRQQIPNLEIIEYKYTNIKVKISHLYIHIVVHTLVDKIPYKYYYQCYEDNVLGEYKNHKYLVT